MAGWHYTGVNTLTTEKSAETPNKPVGVGSLDESRGAKDVASHLDLWIALGIFALQAILYTLTCCRSVYTGDDGDFITAIATTGVSHPTGYPLFCLIGKLFLLLPIGEPAFRINLMSSLSAAAATAFLYRFLALNVSQRVWAVIGALLFGTAPLFWQLALSCEVYTLSCLFVCSLLFLLRRWLDNPENDRLLLGMSVLYGFALTHHMTLLLYLPGFMAIVFRRRPGLLRDGRAFGRLALSFCLPLLLYLYLPLAARFSHSPILWGNTSTFNNFADHVMARQYRHMLFVAMNELPIRARFLGTTLVEQFGWAWLLLAPVGLVALFQDPIRRPFSPLLLWIGAVTAGFAVCYAVVDVAMFYVPVVLMLSIVIAVGGDYLWNRIFAAVAPARPELPVHYLRLVGVVLVTLILIQASRNYTSVDRSQNRLETQFASNILRSAPQNAIIIIRTNAIFSLWYRQHVLGERPDVLVISADLFTGRELGDYWYYDYVYRRYPEVEKAFPPGKARAKDGDCVIAIAQLAINAVRAGRPLLYMPSGFRVEPEEKFFEDGTARFCDRAPWGITYRLYLKGQAPDAATVYRENVALWKQYQTDGAYTVAARSDFLQSQILRRYSYANLDFGKIAEAAGDRVTAENAYTDALSQYDAMNEQDRQGLAEARAGLERCKSGHLL